MSGTNWLGGVKGAPVPSSTHISLSPHHIDPTKTTVSLGDFGGQQKQFWILGNGPDPATVTVRQGTAKYELVYASLYNDGTVFDPTPYGVLGVLLAELLPPDPPMEPFRLPVGALTFGLPARHALFEVFPGKRASEVGGFTSASRVYER